MKKLLLLTIVLLITACGNKNYRLDGIISPQQPKKGDGYIFINYLYHEATYKNLFLKDDSTVRVIFRTYFDDVDEINLVINNKKIVMESAGVIGKMEYYYADIDKSKFNEYYFELRDGKLNYYYGVNSDYEKNKIIKFKKIDLKMVKNIKTDNATYYQIFIDSFYNGDNLNDPIFNELGPAFFSQTLDNKKKDLIDENRWEKYEGGRSLGRFYVQNWTDNFNYQHFWEQDLRSVMPELDNKTKRFGGDIRGIIKKIDYLKSLGINRVIINSPFYSYSAHKMDVIDHRHISPDFGNPINEKNSFRVISKKYGTKENRFGISEYKLLDSQSKDYLNESVDKKSWKWTSSDLLFIDMVNRLKEKGIDSIIDLDLEIVSKDFFAFEDLMKNGPSSKYKKWFFIPLWDKFKDYTEENQDIWNPYIEYYGFGELGVTFKDGKKFRRKWVKLEPNYDKSTYIEVINWNKKNLLSSNVYNPIVKINIANKEVKNYYKSVLGKWIEGTDGKNGIRGYKFVIKDINNLSHYKEINSYLKSLNKNIEIIADYNKENVREILSLGEFDKIFNYNFGRYLMNAVYNDKTAYSLNQLINYKKLESIYYGDLLKDRFISIIDSYDTDRAYSRSINKNLPYDGKNILDKQSYLGIRPKFYDKKALNKYESILMLHLIYNKNPMVYYGSEIAMWGADTPNNRKPMLWLDMEFEDESDYMNKYIKKEKELDKIIDFDKVKRVIKYKNSGEKDLLEKFKLLESYLNKNLSISKFGYPKLFKENEDKKTEEYENKDIFVINRFNKTHSVIIVINNQNVTEKIKIEAKDDYILLNDEKKNYNSVAGKMALELAAYESIVLIKK